MSAELKECPFCGGEAYMLTSYSERARRYYVLVACDDCRAQAARFTCSSDPEKSGWSNDACKRAIKAWNTRRNKSDDVSPEHGEE